MRVGALIEQFGVFDRKGIWAYTIQTLKVIFREDTRAMHGALSRHERLGIVLHVARGLYVNPNARSLPPDVLSALVSFLRPWDTTYLSLESALSEVGWISQIPSRMTLMTTGRSQTFDTPFGILEFTHTARDMSDLSKNAHYDAKRHLWIATPKLALRDLKRVGRNLDLVNIGASEDVT